MFHTFLGKWILKLTIHRPQDTFPKHLTPHPSLQKKKSLNLFLPSCGLFKFAYFEPISTSYIKVLNKFSTMKKILARIYAISIWSMIYGSQYCKVFYSNILAVIWMQCPKRRVAQGNISDHNVTRPQDLNEWPPCVVQKLLQIFCPPSLSLSIYGTIMPCKL